MEGAKSDRQCNLIFPSQKPATELLWKMAKETKGDKILWDVIVLPTQRISLNLWTEW